MAAEDREGVKSLVKALDILECVADSPDGAGVSEVSLRLDINKASVSKIFPSNTDSVMTHGRSVDR